MNYLKYKLYLNIKNLSYSYLKYKNNIINFVDCVDYNFNYQWINNFKINIDNNYHLIYYKLNEYYSNYYKLNCFEKEIGSIFTNSCIIKELYNLIQNKKILLIGGSTSINNINFNQIDYDLVCAVNNFFLNDKINQINPNIIFFNNEIQDNNKLFNYLNNKNIFIFKFAHDDHQSFKNRMKKKEHWIYYNARFNGCSIMNRAISILSFFNPSNIIFCGYDLYDEGHAFEKNKIIKKVEDFELNMTFFMFKVLKMLNYNLTKLCIPSSQSIIDRIFVQS